MKIGFLIGIVVLVIAGAILIPQSFYIVDETQLAIVTRFGKFQSADTTPGIRTKTPFVDTVTKFDKRLLRYDAPAASLLTADKRNLVIDAYARYRIIDPLLFFQRLRDEVTADSRVGDIVSSELRREVALDLQSEIISEIRQEIMERVREASNRAEMSRAEAELLPNGGINDPQLFIFLTPTDLEPDEVGRRQLPTLSQLQAIRGSANPPELANFSIAYFQPLRNAFGIDIVDVRIKRADFPTDIEVSIFDRMRAERERIASGLRAEGAQVDAEIRADVDRSVLVTVNSAEGEAAQLRGEGERQAIDILATELEKDPEFYSFTRGLEAYKKILDSGSTIVLSADSPLFNFLQDPTGKYDLIVAPLGASGSGRNGDKRNQLETRRAAGASFVPRVG